MHRLHCFAYVPFVLALSLLAQNAPAQKPQTSEDLPTSSLISKPGPSFTIPQSDLGAAVRVIAYGDQRFTDPTNTKVTNPAARRLLVQKIAEEHPDAVLMNGDVPYSGDNVNDYEVYKSETSAWRSENLRVFPALGNHEFHGDPQTALNNWWSAFPQFRDRRWYSVELGKSVYTIALDSDTSLAPGSDQLNWLNAQLSGLPKATRFVIISLHHPPVDDIQTGEGASHNARPNEIALRDDLEALAPKLKARIIVCAGHVHNYERFDRNGVVYLVSGGGAAKPAPVVRGSEDLYQDTGFPNYHYVLFTLQGDTLTGKMMRLADPSAATPVWELKDTFEVKAK